MRKGLAGDIFGAVALALIGALCLAAGLLDHQIARAQQNLATVKYDEPDAGFATVERYLEYAAHVPWIGSGPLNDVRARRAALQYWQRRYDLIIPRQGDPMGAISPDNAALQLIVANAVYRTGQAQARDHRTTLQAIDAAINAYLAVLKNVRLNEGAAYNYEYLTRLREDIDKGRRPPGLTDTAEDGPEGRKGGPPAQDSSKRNFKILIPLEPGEMDKGAEPGKGRPLERKG